MKITTALALTLLIWFTTFPAQPQDSPDLKATWNTSVDRAIAYLRKAQSPDAASVVIATSASPAWSSPGCSTPAK